MHSQSLPILLIITSLSTSFVSHALPFMPPQPALWPRAKYSVVAVDGGSGDSAAATSSTPSSPTTVIKTTDQTQTVTASATTQPPATTTIVSMETIGEQGPTSTVEIQVTKDVTQTPAPAAKAEVQIVNVEQDMTLSGTTQTSAQTTTTSTTVSQTLTASTSRGTSSSSRGTSSTSCGTSTTSRGTSSSSASQTQSLQPSTTSNTPTMSSTIPSSSPGRTVTPPTTVPTYGQEAAVQTGVTLIGTSTGSTSRQTVTNFDNGMWHTSYPAWNATSTIYSTAIITATAVSAS